MPSSPPTDSPSLCACLPGCLPACDVHAIIRYMAARAAKEAAARKMRAKAEALREAEVGYGRQKAQHKRKLLAELRLQILRSPVPDGYNARLGSSRVLTLYASRDTTHTVPLPSSHGISSAQCPLTAWQGHHTPCLCPPTASTVPSQCPVVSVQCPLTARVSVALCACS